MKTMRENDDTFPISYRKDNQNANHLHNELLTVIDRFYHTIAGIDLAEDTVTILQDAKHPETVSQVYNWSAYLQASSDLFVDEQKEFLTKALSSDHLLELYQNGETFYSTEASDIKEGRLSSISFFIFFTCRENAPFAYLMARDSSGNHLRKALVDFYVSNNCDFFLYLDAKNSTCTLFNNAKSDTQPLSELCRDYDADIETYTNEFVVPEDRTFVFQNMNLQNVVSQLSQQDVYTFYFGVRDAASGYRRKRFDYRYYKADTKMILLACTDVTEMYQKEQEHRQALFNALKTAQTDMLTGLLNYKGTVENVSKSLAEKPKHAALLFIDVDNFKSVNDTFGHDVGDEVLCQIALILCDEAFKDALIGRIGGDEFIVYFPSITSMEEVKNYAWKVCKLVFQMDYGQKNHSHISCSIGIVEIPKHGYDYKTLVKKADDMTYRAKFTGKNKFVIYDSE